MTGRRWNSGPGGSGCRERPKERGEWGGPELEYNKLEYLDLDLCSCPEVFSLSAPEDPVVRGPPEGRRGRGDPRVF